MGIPSQTVVEGKRRWPDGLLPLVVLYSPLLRLRFRPALQRAVSQVNSICKREILLKPIEAPNSLATELESTSAAPPFGIVYVRDCERRADKEGRVIFWNTSAVVMLPENEDTPWSTLAITTKAILSLLLTSASDDFTKETATFLEKVYSKQ